MKSDVQIQKDVMEELRWQPFLNATQIGVAVKNGIVTLSGQVDGYSKKLQAENAVRKVAGVKAIAEDIQIGVSPAFKKTDTELAEAVLTALKWHSAVQEEKVKIKVENGNVRLEGEVEWEYQRKAAASAVENLVGVKSVTNLILVKPRLKAADIEQKISSAFHRSATLDAQRIKAQVEGGKVILHGSVRSFTEREDAEDAAWAAPGVVNVDNRLEIALSEYAFDD